MSRRARRRQQSPPAAVVGAIVVAPPPVGIIHPAGAVSIGDALGTLNEEPAEVHVRFTSSETAFRHTVDHATGVSTIMGIGEPGECRRQVTFDSLAWSCACGAEGKVGRTKDGQPYVDVSILAHAPRS